MSTTVAPEYRQLEELADGYYDETVYYDQVANGYYDETVYYEADPLQRQTDGYAYPESTAFQELQFVGAGLPGWQQGWTDPEVGDYLGTAPTTALPTLVPAAARPTLVLVERRRPAGLVLSGFLWGMVFLCFAAAGTIPVACLLAILSAMTVGTSMKAIRKDVGNSSRLDPWTVVLAGATPLLSILGPIGLVVGAGATGLAAVKARASTDERSPGRSVVLSVAPALACGSVVLLSRLGLVVVMGFAIAVCLYDLTNSVVGTGITGGLGGALVAAVTVLVFAVLVHSLFVVPFGGVSPWVLFGSLCLLAPIGIRACMRLVGSKRVPALRRMDSFIFVAPLWVVLAYPLLTH